LPGKHTEEANINAYFYNRAKHLLTKKYEIDFKPTEIYTISSNVDFIELKSNTDNVNANLYIRSSKMCITDAIILEDSAMRSIICELSNCKVTITLFL
jgi:hypothetical protein